MAVKYRVEIYKDIKITNGVVTLSNQTTTAEVDDTQYRLTDLDFFNVRYLKVTPFDELGDGVWMLIRHHYKAAPPITVVPIPIGPDELAPELIIKNGFMADYRNLQSLLFSGSSA